MMKRITGILLSIGIILYILPMTAFAADGIVTGSSDYEALRQFLVQFDCGWARGQVYDAHNLTLDNGSRRGNKNIMEAVLTNPSCALLNLYPGEDTKEYGTTGPLEKADPLGKFMMYYKMDANKIDWTLQNIFNCSQNDIAKLRTTLNIAGDSPY